MPRLSRLRRAFGRLRRKKKKHAPDEVVHRNDYAEMEFQFN